jgi:endonuclease/exonuclease/phosphatase family metal-dependent hydrolase
MNLRLKVLLSRRPGNENAVARFSGLLPCNHTGTDRDAVEILEPHRFDKGRGVWARAPAGAPGVRRHTLTLLTYNVWFDAYRQDQRIAALLRLVRGSGPDIVGLQEITPRHLEMILAEEWIRRDYWISDVSAETVVPHGVLLLSRMPIAHLALCELPSEKDRKLLVGQLEINGQRIHAATVHLESAVTNTGLRLEQLDTVDTGLADAAHCVLMGDFNFDPRQAEEQARITGRYRDLWTELRGDEPGYTEDTDLNRMRLIHKQREKRARVDRILLRSTRPGWDPVSIRRIGTRPVSPDEPDVFPSDHFGLVAELLWRDPPERVA